MRPRLTRFHYTQPPSGFGGRDPNQTPRWFAIVVLVIVCLTLLAMCGLITWSIKG